MNETMLLSNTTLASQQQLTLGNVDYFVIVVMLLISSGIGLYFRFSGGKQKTTQEFFLAGRTMSVFPVAFSIMASGNSAITYLGVPSDMYVYGTHFAFIILGNTAGALAAGFLFLPVFFCTNASTTYEYLEKRFGRVLRIICSLSFSIQAILYIAVVLYAPALALSAVTSLSIWTSVISVGVVCTFYCTLGGMKAVLWTDVFQATLMYGGMIIMVIKGSSDVGGFQTVISRSIEGGRLLVPGFFIDFTTRYTFFNIFIYGFVTTLSAYGASQMQVQRLLTVSTLKKAQWALFASLPCTFVFHIVNCFTGLVLYAYFYHCDPQAADNKITKPDQLLPYFSMISLGQYPGVAGLCICGMLSAALSTMSSMVNSLSTVTVEDFMKPVCAMKGLGEERTAFVAKMITLCYGTIGLLLTYIVASFGNVLQASTIVYGLVAGPTLGVFLLGVLTARTNEKGAIIGLLCSISVTAWISFGSASTNIAHPKLPVSTDGCFANQSFMSNITPSVPKEYSSLESFSTMPTFMPVTSSVEEDSQDHIFPLYKISYMWFSPIGVMITVILGYCCSYLFGKPTVFEDNLLNPIVYKMKMRSSKEKENVELTTICPLTNGVNLKGEHSVR
ncbi:putative sodium-dependent multivitamin transporter [Parasteatoda tepidariorum]|uniref:putative sodium-dependent multivitamin transporter n=1 Tax=Parasteatoda tepidariorum TaxID=114398 RepID=UPI00077F87FB|nr:putative sodium-dependent multivitamin transporter [Parasteatoda tepidariorum]